MLQSACYVESSTIHDDIYLNYSDVYDQNEGEQIESKTCFHANGFSYLNGSDYRILIWRILGNRLDLIEQSFINKLNSNAKHIYFNNSTIISPLYICKHENTIQILLTTTTSLYRFILPIRVNDRESILSSITSNDLFSNELNSYQINLQHVDNCVNYVTSQGDALFTNIAQNNSINCIRLPSVNSQNTLVTKYELNQPSVVKRILSGIRRTLNDNAQSVIVSYKLKNINDLTFVVSLCQDFKLKIWNLKTSELYIEDLSKYLKTTESIHWDECSLDVKQLDKTSSFAVVFSIKINDQLNVYWFNIDIVNSQPQIKFTDMITFSKPGRLVEIYFYEKNVWLMCKNDRDELEVSYKSIDNSTETSQIQILLQTQADKDDEIIAMNNLDLKETYLKLIFEPYRFSKSTICKSIGILRQSIIRENEIPESLEALKDLIIQVIENEVRNYPNIQNCTEEEEFLDITSKCWAKFYSILLQYDYDSRLPLGLFVDSKQAFILLIRKNAISVFTRADLTQLYNSCQLSLDITRPYFENISTRINKDSKILKDIQNLFTALNCINDYCLKTSNFMESSDITHLDSTENGTIDLIIDKLITNYESFFTDVENSLQRISNVNQTIELVIEYFISVHKSSEGDMDCFDPKNDNNINSEFTVNCVLASFKYLITKRHEFLRNFCVFLNLIKRYNDKFHLSSSTLNTIENKLSTQVKTLTRLLSGYELLKWLCEIYPYPIHKSSLEKNLRRTNDLLNFSSLNRATLISVKDYDHLLLKSFVQTFARNVLTSLSVAEISTYWLPSILNDIFKLVWPEYGNYDFTRFLMHNVQYIHLNNYCMSLKWWNEGKYLRSFLLGHCCLFWDEIDKSIDLFLKASFNLDDSVLKEFLAFNTTELNPLNYYTKIIHYYDLNGNIDAVIELIHKAIPSCKCEMSRSKLYCILFKSYMDLEYYEQAFEALMTNTDMEWKRNCLKQFIIELCNKNKAVVLLNFEYSYMQEYVKEILHKRSINSDLRAQDYYSILYSFYLKNSDYIKAACCMYEYALRLKKELTGINSLLKQEKCYLSCLNCLKLVNVEYRWLCLSYIQQFDEMNNVKNYNFTSTDNIDEDSIVKFEDINKNYLIVHYLIKISAFTSNQSSVATYYSVDELVGLLVKYGFFDDAIILCLAFKSIDTSPLTNIFIALTDRCCKLNNQNNVEDLQFEVEWLKYNESLPPSTTPYENPNSLKWRLLQTYLDKYKDVVYYKAVCKRILTLGFEIPSYIIKSFKTINSSALLQILINYGLLEDACNLSIDYIDAILTNRGIENFDIKNALHAHSYPVVLPYSSLDQLLLTLQSADEKELRNLYDKLKDKLDIYFNTAKDVSDSRLSIRKTGMQTFMRTY